MFNLVKHLRAQGLGYLNKITQGLTQKMLNLPRVLSFPVITPLIVSQLKELNTLLPVGRLHTLFEACGKVRTIAIFDGIRQMLLKPVHDELFKTITTIFSETSVIFNQTKGVREFAKLNNKVVYSFDISAATDTISRHLYLPMMEYLLGKRLAEIWLGLLTDHPFIQYGCSSSKDPVHIRISEAKEVYYGRGQPMGGYSSFGALDLFHHLLIQFSAFVVGRFDIGKRNEIYTNYRVLGDDVVIGDADVAASYFDTCIGFQIPISKNKSLVSKSGVFTFVSEVFKGKTCLSPLSLRNHYASNTLSSRLSFAIEGITRGYGSNSVTGLAMSMLRLGLNRSQYEQEIVRFESNRVGIIFHHLSHFLTTLFQGFESWTIGHWVQNLVNQKAVMSTLRGLPMKLNEAQLNLAVCLFRQLLFDGMKILRVLIRAERSAWSQVMELARARFAAHGGFKEQDSYYSRLCISSDRVFGLWDTIRELLDEQEATEEWLEKTFLALQDILSISNEVSSVPATNPLDFIVHLYVSEEVKYDSSLRFNDIESIRRQDLTILLVQKILELYNRGPFIKRLFADNNLSPYACEYHYSESARKGQRCTI